MPEKWKKHRPFQNWKKGIAILLWHWLIAIGTAQTLPQLPEISTRDGLPTASTRRVVELPSGSILVATDGGLHYAPKNQPVLSRIQQTIGIQQCWDIHLWGNSIFVATYNNGLYRFDLERGNLIHHYNQPQFNKIRRLREVKGRLFCIARYGIYEILGNTLKLRLLSERDLPKDNMPMDVFIRKGQLHALCYPDNTIMQQQLNGQWISWNGIHIAEGKQYPESFYNNLCAFQTDSTVVLGGVNRYTVINDNDHWRLYTLNTKQNESWAFWDFQIHQNQIYAAVSNSNDFNDGFLHRHQPQITSYNPPHSQSLWSITPSKFRDAIWISTETDGVHLLIQPEKNQFVPLDFNAKILATEHFTIGCNTDYLLIDYLSTGSSPSNQNVNSQRVNCDDRIRDVVEINRTVYLLGAKKLWQFNPRNGLLEALLPAESFQWIQERNGLLWLFKPYNNIWLFDPNTEKLTETNNEGKADCVRKSEGVFYYHIMGKTFAYIDDNGQQKILKPNRPINQYTLNFEVIGNQLLIENGNAYDVFRIDKVKQQLLFEKTLNLSSAFRDLSILQILSDGKHLYVYSGQYLIEIALGTGKTPITVKRQLYLGHWRIQGPAIMAGDRFIIDRGNTVQTVSFEGPHSPNFEVQYSYRNEPQSFFKPYFAVNTEKNFRITVFGTHYFDLLRAIYTVDLVDVKTGENLFGFFRGDAYYWINGIGQGKFNLTVSLNHQWASQFIIGTTEFYRDFPFWLMLVSILSLLYWVFYNQIRTQESQQKRIATLQLQTLQSNFNPHFIYNSMSLIQSLIIGSETKKAIDVTARLAKLNRLFLSNSNKELIYLKDELDFIKEYVAMEKLRFESDTQFPFQIRVNSKVRVTEWLIPPMILQPLIENAIKHGVLVSKGPAEIYIDIKLSNIDELEIKIVNTHAMRSKKRIHGLGIGNQLVSDRLDILNELYPNQFQTQFDFGFRADQEYHATIWIKRLLETVKRINRA